MKQYEKIKEEVSKIASAIEMAGYLDSINARAIIYCHSHYPDEVNKTSCGHKVSITGMNKFLNSDVINDSLI